MGAVGDWVRLLTSAATKLPGIVKNFTNFSCGAAAQLLKNTRVFDVRPTTFYR